jgi:hypothetical protein
MTSMTHPHELVGVALDDRAIHLAALEIFTALRGMTF